MNKPFNVLREKMSSSAQKKADEKTKQLLIELPLQELRQARHMSQEKLAEILDTMQAK